MIIRHELRKQSVEGEGSSLFLLANAQGDFFSLAENDYSKYQGLIFNHNNDYFKIIDSIKLRDSGPIKKITNYFDRVERDYDNEVKEIFRITNKGLIYSVQNYYGIIILELDMRRIQDYTSQGRIYSHNIEPGRLITHYKKFLDDSLQNLDYELYLSILGVKEADIINDWIEKNYPYEERRNDSGKLWVNYSYNIKVEGAAHLVFSTATQKHTAIEKSNEVAKHIQKILRDNKNNLLLLNKNSLELNTAIFALNQLKISREGEKRTRLIAGIPWFYQTWLRDELVSSKALLLQKDYEFLKRMILDYFEQYHIYGFKAMIEGQGLESKDSAVWLARRTLDLLKELRSKKLLAKHFTDHELGYIREKTRLIIKKLISDKDLIYCEAKETWMDTIPRIGYPLEVQLALPLLFELEELLSLLTKDKTHYSGYLKKYSKKLKKLYFKDGLLADRLDENLYSDFKIRPNVFLAYYLCEQLLTKKEWEKIFDRALPKLFLNWGALSSIDKDSNLFKEVHTGSNNDSYHNGDSWYYINNLAAICLKNINHKKYKIIIDKIIFGSVSDLLFQGAIAASSEISSAVNQESLGCFNQAWSNALLIELLWE